MDIKFDVATDGSKILRITELETRILRAAFLDYQDKKRKEAAANLTADSKGYATLLGGIESLQAKIGYPTDKDN